MNPIFKKYMPAFIGSVISVVLLVLFLSMILPLLMARFAWNIPENFEFIASRHMKDGNFRKAENILIKAAERRPWDFRPLKIMGDVMLEKENRPEALRYYLNASKVAFNSTSYANMLSPPHRENLANLYFTTAQMATQEDKDAPEKFYYFYSGLLDETYEKKIESIFGSTELFLKKPLESLKDSEIRGKESLPSTGNESDGIRKTETGWLLLRVGEINYELTAKQSEHRCFYVSVRGTGAYGINPIIEVIVNGDTKEFLYTGREGWNNFEICSDLNEGDNTIALLFLNDGAFPELDTQGNVKRLLEDRNVEIAGIYLKQ